MKTAYIRGLTQIALCAGALVAVLMVAIYKRQLELPERDRFYPAILACSIIYLHWMSWRLFFDLIGLPDKERIKIEKDGIKNRSGWKTAIGLGYFFLILSLFNQYVSPKYTDADVGVGYTLVLLAAGIIGQMTYVTRHLITKKYNEEGA